MSWEVVQSTRTTCPCGKGEIERIWETDDWNRSRTKFVIHCAACDAANERLFTELRQQQTTMRQLLETARSLATERYLPQWLLMYAGLSKKDAWRRYRDGKGYPALGTFYIHIRHAGGLEKHLKEIFDRDFVEIMKRMKVEDREITALLDERATIAETLPSPMPQLVQEY